MRFFRLYFLFIFCGIIHNGISQENINFLYKLKVATSKSDSIKVLIYLSEEYRFSTPEKGLETSILAYELSLELKDTVLMILSSNKKAQLQNGNSLENLALGSIIKSLYWAKKIKNDNLLANTRLIAGHVYRSLKDTDKSLSNYKDALGYFLYVNDSIGISSTYSGMGKVYYDLGNNIKALDQYLLSERYWIDSLTSLKANLWNNIGAVYIELEDFDDAKKYFEKALLIYFNQEWYAEMSMIYCNLGELELYRRNFDLSLDFYNNSLKIGHKINSPTEVMWANEGLYRNKRQSGNLKSALINFENYKRIRS
jgi:tetratricopeptide (TPR) repeat protein